MCHVFFAIPGCFNRYFARWVFDLGGPGWRKNHDTCSPPPPPSFIFFFALVPAFYTNLARKRLLRSLRILALLQGKTLIETAHWKSHMKMLKTALFDCANNEKCCSVDGGRGICPLFSSPPRGIWQLKSPHPREFAIQGKINANARGSASGVGGLSAGGIDWCIIQGKFVVIVEDSLVNFLVKTSRISASSVSSSRGSSVICVKIFKHGPSFLPRKGYDSVSASASFAFKQS